MTDKASRLLHLSHSTACRLLWRRKRRKKLMTKSMAVQQKLQKYQNRHLVSERKNVKAKVLVTLPLPLVYL